MFAPNFVIAHVDGNHKRMLADTMPNGELRWIENTIQFEIWRGIKEVSVPESSTLLS